MLLQYMQCCFVHLQEACVQGNLIAICLEQLTDPYPPLRQWLAICLGRVWFNYEAARWCAVRDSAPDKLYCLLSDPLPEVRVMIMCFFRKCPQGFLISATPTPQPSRKNSLVHTFLLKFCLLRPGHFSNSLLGLIIHYAICNVMPEEFLWLFGFFSAWKLAHTQLTWRVSPLAWRVRNEN